VLLHGLEHRYPNYPRANWGWLGLSGLSVIWDVGGTLFRKRLHSTSARCMKLIHNAIYHDVA
jgi:hypothetical protein